MKKNVAYVTFLLFNKKQENPVLLLENKALFYIGFS